MNQSCLRSNLGEVALRFDLGSLRLLKHNKNPLQLEWIFVLG